MSAWEDGEEGRIVDGERSTEDTPERALRPVTLDDFVGQKQMRENLKVFLAARPASARRRWPRSSPASWG